MDEGLHIDWTQMPTYNTIMALAAGAGLLTLVLLGRSILLGRRVSYEGYAVNFAVLGVILTITGAHMTLTWPFAKYFPFDNIIFGEPSLGFGVLLIAAAFLLWKRSGRLQAADDAAEELRILAAPLGVFVIALGLSLLAIAAAGLVFQLFAAPPEEPISGLFAQWPWVEATFMSGLFAITGVGAILTPFSLARLSTGRRPGGIQLVTGITLGLSGLVFVLFGALNVFTHIGLIINTM